MTWNHKVLDQYMLIAGYGMQDIRIQAAKNDKVNYCCLPNLIQNEISFSHFVASIYDNVVRLSTYLVIVFSGMVNSAKHVVINFCKT